MDHECREHRTAQRRPVTDTETKAKQYQVPCGGVQVFRSPGHGENFEDLSFAVGRTFEWDPMKERVLNDDEANRLLSGSGTRAVVPVEERRNEKTPALIKNIVHSVGKVRQLIALTADGQPVWVRTVALRHLRLIGGRLEEHVHRIGRHEGNGADRQETGGRTETTEL